MRRLAGLLAADRALRRREDAGPSGGARGPWNRTPARSAMRALPMPQDRQPAVEPDTSPSAALQGRHHPDQNKHLKSLVLGWAR